MSLSQRACLALLVCLPIQFRAQQLPGPAVAAQTDAASPSAAQAPPPASAPKTTAGRIHLDVVVTDKSGKPVTGLGPNDFTLLDNNQPSKILSFRAVDSPPADGTVQKAEPPVELILLIDEVNTGPLSTAQVQNDLKKFLHENGGHLALPVTLLILTDQGLNSLSPPTVDGNTLAVEVTQTENKQRTINPSSGEWGRDKQLTISIQALAAIARSETKRPGRKLLIWLGAGWPTWDIRALPASPRTFQNSFDWIVKLSTQLREARISVYTPGTSLSYERFLQGVKMAEEANIADLQLGVLSVESGGKVLTSATDKDLAAQIDRCIQSESAFYALSIDPPYADQADRYHELKVKIDQPKLTARTSAGYYNQPQAESRAANDNSVGDKPVTVAQLDQSLSDVHDRPDTAAARQLSGLVLSERLSNAKLSALQAGLPGPKARQALLALADASTFLPPPAAEIPANAPPDLATQRQIMAQAVDYIGKTLPKLPNFFATRTTKHYEELRPKPGKAGKETPGGSLRLTDTFSATVHYRDGHEVVEPDTAKGKKPGPQAEGLVIKGTFGPILSLVIDDAPNGHLKWSHWEQGAQGPVGVFHFAVPKNASHYSWNDSSSPFSVRIDEQQQPTAYHGEIAVDPATGTILRLVLEADREPGSPMIRADIMVEYGPVEIGGKTYFCPVKSVWLSRESIDSDTGQISGPAMTMLNDVAFGDYHVFRTEVKLLSGDDPLPDAK